MRIFDREQWKKTICFDSAFPYWVCNECNEGSLQKKDQLIAEPAETKWLRTSDDGPGLDVDNYYAHMTIKLECSNPRCLSESLLSGVITNEYSDDYYSNDDYNKREHILDVFSPLFFTIPPQVIFIPEGTPEDQKEMIQQSFKVFFDDPNSSANKIRIFLEKLVPKDVDNKGNLHQRLEKEFKDYRPDILNLLLASKWIGNDASHEADITHEDILDSYEFIELALGKLYPEDHSSILSKAGSINTHKKSSSKIKS